MVGAEIFAIVDSIKKRDFLMQTHSIPKDRIIHSGHKFFAQEIMRLIDNHGVDVAVNSSALDISHQASVYMVMFGRFLDLDSGDTGSGSKQILGSTQRSLSFLSVDLSSIFQHNRLLAARLLSRAVDLLHSHSISIENTTTAVSVTDIKKAFKLKQDKSHIGHVVVTNDNEEVVHVSTFNYRLFQTTQMEV